MDSKEIPGESIVVSVSSSPCDEDGGIEQEDLVTPNPTWPRKHLKQKQSWPGKVEKLMRFAIVVLLTPFMLVLTTWNRVFILSCVAISLDCLFLYIPIVDQEHKCIRSDKRLRNIALVLRSVTDMAFMAHIFMLINGLMAEITRIADSLLEREHAATIWYPAITSINQSMKAPNKMSWFSINVIVSFLAILPIPQIAIVAGFYKLGGSKHSSDQTVINVFLILQYILRIFQIFLSIKNVGDTVGKMVKGSFYFLLYIIASLVLAAFWYFFSVQREISCWDKVCQVIGECIPLYECDHPSLNNTSVSKLCSVDSPNVTFFDYGMFLEVLQSGNTSSTRFTTKFFYTFWWGLKNLSNFGTSLETSSNTWENCFAILICVVGLLLFLFLIGNVQTYMQSVSEKFVNNRDSRQKKIDTKYSEIENWMSSHEVPEKIKKYTMENVREARNHWFLQCLDDDVGACFLAYCYFKPSAVSDPLHFICLQALRRISFLQGLGEIDLHIIYKRAICDFHKKDSLIAEAGKELDCMYLIIDGTVECNYVGTMSTQILRRYDCVGEEVVRWAISNYKKSKSEQGISYPVSTFDAKCQTHIESFTIFASSLFEELGCMEPVTSDRSSDTFQRIEDWLKGYGFPDDMRYNIIKCIQENNLIVDENMSSDIDVAFLYDILPRDFKSSIKHRLGITALKKVAMLQSMHDYVLDSLCNYLQPMVYKEKESVVRAGEPLGIMIFILRGRVILTDMTSSNITATGSSEINQTLDENVVEVHGYYGEQLLRYVSPNNISCAGYPVMATADVICQTKVEALILKVDDLKSVATKCGSQWNLISNMNSSQHLVGNVRDTAADSRDLTPTRIEETAIQLHQGQDMLLEQLLLIRETMFRFRDDNQDMVRKLDDQGRRLDEMAAFLAGLGFNGTSPPAAAAP